MSAGTSESYLLKKILKTTTPNGKLGQTGAIKDTKFYFKTNVSMA